MNEHHVKMGKKLPSSDIPRLEAVLGRARFLSELQPAEYRTLPVVLDIDRGDYERYQHQPGQLTATIDFHLRRSTLVGALPVAKGAVLRAGRAWFSVAGLRRIDDDWRILVRWSDPQPLWAAELYPRYEFILR